MFLSGPHPADLFAVLPVAAPVASAGSLGLQATPRGSPGPRAGSDGARRGRRGSRFVSELSGTHCQSSSSSSSSSSSKTFLRVRSSHFRFSLPATAPPPRELLQAHGLRPALGRKLEPLENRPQRFRQSCFNSLNIILRRWENARFTILWNCPRRPLGTSGTADPSPRTPSPRPARGKNSRPES